MREDDRVDALHVRAEACGLFQVALNELDAGQHALAPAEVTDERRDGELVAL